MSISLNPKQINKLGEIYQEGSIYRNDDDTDLELINELVRKGLVDNLIVMSGNYNWSFSLTEEGEEFINALNL